MVGRTISHYEVVEKIGEGGMGLVYKARDLQLGRFVAIKVLVSSNTSRSDRRARFIQEARSASSLNHPNIITIHDIVHLDKDEPGEAECIVMEWVRGQTLADVLHHGKLPVVDCLKLATQIADALAAAHSIGIVHRDLKPANVMVTPEGLAKVLDFGLAKLAGEEHPDLLSHESAESETTRSMHISTRPQTAEGTIIGTVAYMSPEQAQGRSIDARSDTFSFGALLYEMLTGRRAFHGDSSIATLTAVLRDDPKPIAKLGVEAPGELNDILTRCLKKDPAYRYQSMAEVKDALEHLYLMMRSATLLSVTQIASNVWRQPVVRAVPSIAVLPFLNLSSDKENEYFSDGLAEEIINALTKLEHLKVTARTSAFVFRGGQHNVKEIGEKLNVGNVLEGSVRRSGNRVRVSVQLIGVEEGNNLWSERFDREMTDVFEIQDEISQAVVARLKVRLASQSGSGLDPLRPVVPIVKRYTDNLDAYDAYLRGRFELYKMTREGLDAAIHLFEDAIRLDANYSLAHDGLAYTLYSQGFLGFTAPNVVMPKAKAAARRALELDDTVSDAHATLGTILALYDWDWAAAEREFLRSMDLNNTSSVARDLYAFFFLRPVSRLEEAISETQQALALDPLSILFRVHLGFLFYLQRQNEHSIAQFRKVLEMNPNYYLAHSMLGQVYTVAGDYAEALACYERARAADVDSRFIDSLKAMTLAGAGRREEALALLGEITKRAADGYISPVSIAYVHTFLDDPDQAFASLERGVRERDPNTLGLKSNPIFDRLRADHRYGALLATMHLEA